MGVHRVPRFSSPIVKLGKNTSHYTISLCYFMYPLHMLHKIKKSKKNHKLPHKLCGRHVATDRGWLQFSEQCRHTTAFLETCFRQCGQGLWDRPALTPPATHLCFGGLQARGKRMRNCQQVTTTHTDFSSPAPLFLACTETSHSSSGGSPRVTLTPLTSLSVLVYCPTEEAASFTCASQRRASDSSVNWRACVCVCKEVESDC